MAVNMTSLASLCLRFGSENSGSCYFYVDVCVKVQMEKSVTEVGGNMLRIICFLKGRLMRNPNF